MEKGRLRKNAPGDRQPAELSGAVIKQDTDALTGTYGDSPDVHAILAGQVATPKDASAFVTKLAAEFPQGAAAPQP